MAAELTFAEARRLVIAALERAADTLKRLPIPRNGMPARVSTQRENVPYYSNMRMSPFAGFWQAILVGVGNAGLSVRPIAP